jgi:hypothetical protein
MIFFSGQFHTNNSQNLLMIKVHKMFLLEVLLEVHNRKLLLLDPDGQSSLTLNTARTPTT